MMSYLNAPKNAPFILASASPRRQALLASAQIDVDEILPADIDEMPLRSESPDLYAKRMANTKAQTIARRRPSGFVLGADTVVACGRRILPKAETTEELRACLKLLSGRQHRVYTCLLYTSPSPRD